MTAANQLSQSPLPGHGYRKLTSAGGMLLAGEVAGQEALKYVWDSIILILNMWLEIPLDPMPENVAARVFSVLAIVAFYKTRES